MTPRLILSGPTASGKGEVAHEVARRTGAEILVMDSMKIYREMDIVTAKPSPQRRAEVRYHLLDLADCADEFSVGDYLSRAIETVRDVESRGKPVVFCGGTALYLQALLAGLFRGPRADWGVRTQLIEEARTAGLNCLYERLRALDAPAAQKIHPNDERRIVRALEVCALTGTALTRLWTGPSARLEPGTCVLVGLAWQRPELYRRIDARVLRMAREGLFEEAEALSLRSRGLGRAASRCIGIKEIVALRETGASREATLLLIQRNTRRFAKQQGTWHRRFPFRWIQASGTAALSAWVEEALRHWERGPDPAIESPCGATDASGSSR